LEILHRLPLQQGTRRPATPLAQYPGMHPLFVLRAHKLMGCLDESGSVLELELIANTAEAYEIERWPKGKIPGGKRDDLFTHLSDRRT
jgi:hypothetical protein